MNPYRSHKCHELRASHAGETVRLAGWIHNKRDLGGVLFIDLRDHYGLTQIVVPPIASFQDALSHLPKETVISVQGQVRLRPEGTLNPNIPTGEIELDVTGYDKLGSAEPLPMNVFPEDHTPEETRLKYRFLDLRRSKLHQTVMLRAKIISSIRRRMIDFGFAEFQTPILTSSSPEGRARLPRPPSPPFYPGRILRACRRRRSSFKQLAHGPAASTAIFQIAPLLPRTRDGPRGTALPANFYQLGRRDELSSHPGKGRPFRRGWKNLFRRASFAEFSTFPITPTPFPRIPYKESLLKYGTDKPDLRIPVEIKDLTPLFATSEFKAFAGKKPSRAMAIPPGLRPTPAPGSIIFRKRRRSSARAGLAYVKVEKKFGPIQRKISIPRRGRACS